MKKIHYSFAAVLLIALAFASQAWAADTAKLYDDGLAALNSGDDEKAFAIWSQAAEGGHAQAQNELGIMYRNGRGVAKDDEKAFFWYSKAAEQGHVWGQTNLARLYRFGEGVAKDEKKAVEWYRKAADQGNAEAQNGLGVMYANGRGVSKDNGQAVSWYRKAADQGNAYAQYNLGWMYETGSGVTKNNKQAIEWYRKAADQEHDGALNRLDAAMRAGRWKPTAEERAAYRNTFDSSFPAFSSTTLDDKPVTDEIFAGNKLTMVNFWATWCPPCREEMPGLAKLGKSMPEATQLVGILVDVGDKGAISQAEKILGDAGADFLQIKTNDVIQDADLTPGVIPTTIFIDSEGRLVGEPIAGKRHESEYRAEIEERLELMERQKERRETLLQ